MMHFEEVVVTLVDNNKKPFRELNSQRQDRGRKCEVYAPVDTEYKFLIKNNTDRRIKVDIDIDGTNVSGNGLILEPHATDYVERFIDVDKKFKTSRVTGEGVADPTSPENGIIKVRVHKEIGCFGTYLVAQPIVIEKHIHHDHWYRDYWGNRPYWGNLPMCGGGVYGANIGSNKNQPLTYSVTHASTDSVPVAYNASVAQPTEALATVEGSKSNQSFTTTTWFGDDMAFGEVVFTFYLKLAQQAVDPEYLKYLELKQKFEK